MFGLQDKVTRVLSRIPVLHSHDFCGRAHFFPPADSPFLKLKNKA